MCGGDGDRVEGCGTRSVILTRQGIREGGGRSPETLPLHLL